MLFKISSPILSLQIVDRKNKTASLQKFSKKAIAEMDPEEYIYHDVEILHSVLTEPKSAFLLQPDTERFINANADCWTDKELLENHCSFLANKQTGENADVFVEHLQVKELSKGKVFDSVALKDAAGIVTVHLLIGTAKRHQDLIGMIESNIYNAVSMGCSVDHVLCTICGAKTEDDYACSHLIYDKGRMIAAVDGKMRMCAELCFGSNFYDCSWVRFPADALAVVKERIA